MQQYVLLLARVLMAYIFLFSGYHKAMDIGPTEGFMQALHLPTFLAYVTVAFELGNGLLVLLGAYTRVAALLLAGFCLFTAFLVHFHPDDPGQMLHFYKNTCMAGGFLALFVAGGGKLSLGEQLKLRWS